MFALSSQTQAISPFLPPQLRVKVLVCLGQMLNALDREVVLGQVLPQLAGLQSREPAVLMSTLGIYHAVFHSKKFTVTRQYLASSVIPHLLSLSLATSLNVTQVRTEYAVYMHTYCTYITQV